MESPRVGVVWGNHGASWFGVTSEAITKVGLWDENFTPAYYEDCDWHYRASLLGVPKVHLAGVSAIHGDENGGSCTINSTKDSAGSFAKVGVLERNLVLYKKKWGGAVGRETFSSPFGDGRPVWAWKYDAEEIPAKRDWE